MKKLLILLPLIFLAACEEDKKALYANPSTNDVGVYDGCVVKFVNRGWPTESFFLAKCTGDSVTTTNNAMITQGKSQVLQRRTVIAEEVTKVQELENKKELLKKQIQDLSAQLDSM